MANVPKAITDLPVASAMGDDDLLVVSQNATTSSIKGELIKGYAQNAVASQVTAAQTAANQAGQSATQAEAARQGAAAAQTAAENAQDAAETARDQSVAAAGTIGDSVEQAQTAAGQASSARDAAVAAQTAAETAKTAAETASGQAQTAATQAAGSATAAQTAATQAGDAKTGAETARNEAETSASSAANSASDAESAAAEAEQAKTYIENMDMEGETLPAGSSVTVTKTTSPEGGLLFVIGVPQGIQGDKGETGETGATGPQGVSVTNATVNEDGDLVITLSAGEPINAGSVIGPQGVQGEVGPTGASVDHIERTSGTGAPGTTDTYTVYLTDGQTGGTFQVYNGSNGTGSGDFMADGSVPMTGALQMGGNRITNVGAPQAATDAVRQSDLEAVSQEVDHILDGTTPAYIPPATSVKLGGVIVGDGIEVEADGTISTTPVPEGGTEGQMLYKSADGAAWGDKPVMYVTVTQSSDGSGHKVDKDAGEIKAAYEAGSSVFLVWDRNDLGKDDWQVIPLSNMDISANGNHYARFLNLNYSAVVDVDGDVDITEVVFTSSEITYNNSNSGLTSTNAQDAINEVQENVENVLPTGGTPGQVLTKTSTGEEWSDAPSGLPEGGTEGQILEKTSSGAAWVDKPESGLTQEQADERYLQLTGGTIEVDALSTALTLKNTKSTGDVSDVNRSPYLNFETGNGKVVNEYIDFGSGRAEVAFYDVENDDFVAITGLLDPVYGADAANKSYVDSKAPLPPVPVTLTTSGWSSNTQTVTVPGVVASEIAQLITPTPAIASQSAYYEAGIMCTGQAANSLTFTCQTVPTSNLTVYVVIQPLG